MPAPVPDKAPPPKRNHALDTLKKIGRVAIPIVIGAVIVHNNQGHGDNHSNQQSADRRIDVSPRTLNVTGRASYVTVKNIGKDAVTINSVTVAGEAASLFRQQGNCGTLAPGQSCQIYVTLLERSDVRATLVVDSNGGRATVDLVGPNVSVLK